MKSTNRFYVFDLSKTELIGVLGIVALVTLVLATAATNSVVTGEQSLVSLFESEVDTITSLAIVVLLTGLVGYMACNATIPESVSDSAFPQRALLAFILILVWPLLAASLLTMTDGATSTLMLVTGLSIVFTLRILLLFLLLTAPVCIALWTFDYGPFTHLSKVGKFTLRPILPLAVLLLLSAWM